MVVIMGVDTVYGLLDIPLGSPSPPHHHQSSPNLNRPSHGAYGAFSAIIRNLTALGQEIRAQSNRRESLLIMAKAPYLQIFKFGSRKINGRYVTRQDSMGQIRRFHNRIGAESYDGTS
jgi:hypothetical protein